MTICFPPSAIFQSSNHAWQAFGFLRILEHRAHRGALVTATLFFFVREMYILSAALH